MIWTYLLVVAFVVVVEVSISFNSVLLPNIKEHFTISNQLAQSTISLGLCAVGISGLFYGGLCDCFGRRPMFLLSITLFTIGSLLCSVATTPALFIAARVIQGVGAGAGWIVGNAALSDLFHGKEYLNVMNRVHAIAGITPAVAPILGSFIAKEMGWQNCFTLLGLFSLISGVCMLLKMPESLKIRRSFSSKEAVQRYFSLFQSSRLRHYLCLKVMAVMLLFVEVANAPLIFISYFGLSATVYSLWVLALFFAYLLGNALCSPLLERYNVDQLLEKGHLILFIGCFLLFVASILLPQAWVLHNLLRALIYFSWGMLFGNCTAQIVKSIPGSEGASSATMISLEMLCSSIAIGILGKFFDGTYFAIMLFFSMTSLFLYFKQRSWLRA